MILVASTLTKTISVKQKERLIRKLMYPKLSLLRWRKSGFAYQLSMEEIGYTQLEENAVTRTSTITTVVREMRKGIEYLVWYSIEKGYDKNGNEVIGSVHLGVGLDKDVEIKSMRNSEGEVIRIQLSNITRDILTEEFSSDKLEQLLSKKSMRHESLTQPLGYKGGFGPVVFVVDTVYALCALVTIHY